MEVTDRIDRRESPIRSGDRRDAWPSTAPSRVLTRVVLLATGLVAASATVSAHTAHDTGGAGSGVAFAVVLGLPIVAGLVGGVVTVRHRMRTCSSGTSRRSNLAFGVFLLGLAAASVLTALTMGVWLSIAGVIAGVIAALWFATRSGRGAGRCRGHAELTFGGLFLHRLLEGLLVGALYSTGAAVGVLGAVAIAGHTTLETAAVGGVYAPYRLQGLLAVALVQVGYAVGGLFGVGVGETVPPSARILSLAFAGGVLLLVGSGETRHSTTSRSGPTIGETDEVGDVR